MTTKKTVEKVWVLEQGEYFKSGNIMGVYARREDAVRELEQVIWSNPVLKKHRKMMMEMLAYQNEEQRRHLEMYVCAGSMIYSVVEHKVKQ